MKRIAFMSTYVPQKCGLATYTHHLRQSIRTARSWSGIDPVIVMTAQDDRKLPEDPSLWMLPKHERSAYRAMAAKINRSDVGAVSLQHEFGIFGGEAGSYVLDFIERLDKPLITTFHTVFQHPEEPYRSIQERIARRSDRIVVMNRKAIVYLQQSYGIPSVKIDYIPHGTPEPRTNERAAIREKSGWADKKVLLTFGLLSRGKGLETVIRALPDVLRKVPNALYVIMGQTHPEVRRTEGEAYREQLQSLVHELGLDKHVRMVNEYVDEDRLADAIAGCDLYVTPYPGLQQITSGTLAYAIGLGRPVLSTPYSYAEDILGGCPELLVPAGDSEEWGRRIASMLSDPAALRQWEDRIARIGQGMQWPQVGKAHIRLFDQAAAAKHPETDREKSALSAGGRRIVS
ncbi:glycosyltransferase family 4 protein [Paenibacillus humicola]|uniref:glycosyltransferase family 4 protein n=1 Tax=Paenibacillus humicola TaxID=3110540 RepID=UPI00237C162A|nr:glycosyltransferase family 4 protein [Paenibacillus humicola]